MYKENIKKFQIISGSPFYPTWYFMIILLTIDRKISFDHITNYIFDISIASLFVYFAVFYISRTILSKNSDYL